MQDPNHLQEATVDQILFVKKSVGSTVVTRRFIAVQTVKTRFAFEMTDVVMSGRAPRGRTPHPSMCAALIRL